MAATVKPFPEAPDSDLPVRKDAPEPRREFNAGHPLLWFFVGFVLGATFHPDGQ